MYARRGVQAVAVLLVAGFCSAPSFSQSTQFLKLEAGSLHLPAVASSAGRCSGGGTRSFAAKPDDAFSEGDALSPCSHSVSGIVPLPPRSSVSAATADSSVAGDAVRDNLNTLGKQGRAIQRARDKALEILQSENACSAWYRTKDPDPAATFRTLNFSLDRGAQPYVQTTPDSGGVELIRNPYVASVTQANGPYAVVSLNLNGAFFFPMATVVEDRREGGPVIFHGVRPIRVGPYSGGTFRAQVVTLLHEFGHVIDLLPQDTGDVDGKSRQNTEEVLQFCREQVESKEAPHTFLASH